MASNANPRSGERGHGSPRRDAGSTFIEVLVAVVLMGIGGVATLTALYVSIQGSDQHRSKVSAIAELEGAGAYLARTAWDTTCATPVADLNTRLDLRTGTENDGISVDVSNTACSPDSLPIITLTATSDKGDAIESLDVTVGGISVLNPGSGASPGPGCVWGTLSASPQSGVNVFTNGAKAGQLKGGASISLVLNYTGSCAGPIDATITSLLTGPFTRQLTQDPSSPLILNRTLVDTEIYWRPGEYTVSVPLAGVADATFIIG